ncbi:hypothetical protein [Desulfonatronovibrio hydrogenovorans]|uniref:hypothetical protein n=1 Tax=Desulfonatronovibrio hydrogenovorans TaxID=53245 RepID=UPI00048F3B70|nr:hypothetical protein [Desulfonatronovibrio hydrogenovorans]
MKPENFILYSGGARGAEACFGSLAEKNGLDEVNYSFEGHSIERSRGVRYLTNEELARKDVSITYVSNLMHRSYSRAPIFRKVLQTICWQVSSGMEIFVVGEILEDMTVKGGTGWGAEYAKICNKPLFVFDQVRDGWFRWTEGSWQEVKAPMITKQHFTGTGTRFLADNGQKALEDLFKRSF